jgi:hypothetical protein
MVAKWSRILSHYSSKTEQGESGRRGYWVYRDGDSRGVLRRCTRLARLLTKARIGQAAALRSRQANPDSSDNAPHGAHESAIPGIGSFVLL